MYHINFLTFYWCHNYTAIPTPSTEATCLVSTPSDGNLNVLLQWSSFYNLNYEIERYDVAVTPDPSSCSSELVSPSENYSCSGLDLQTNYSITVSAINCGDQEGGNVTFMVNAQLIGMCIHNLLRMHESFNRLL